ncbi:MAG: SAM-dependent methyltransferase [Solirubrobacteraceae bacterium MAG38_C4-C5]|nr:SAM-dependent methyltransferase [Candidatus Siliceabacter maunaloa]
MIEVIDPSGATQPAVARVVEAVPAWWARRARLAGMPPAWQHWRQALSVPPIELGETPGESLRYSSGFALGEAYAGALSHTERQQYGRHYTPRPLANALWREVERSGITLPEGPVVDPASGAGALLLRPLRQYVQEWDGSNALGALLRAAKSFTGVENDPFAAWIGNAVLAAELLPLWVRVPERERAPLPQLISTGNGLDLQFDSASVVLMNPPYGRAALDADSRRRWASSLYGHANWYAVFLHAAVERVVSGGVVAAVLPASFLGGAYYRRLRRFLGERAPLTRLRLIDDRSGVFASGVLQETCLAVFHKGAPTTRVACSTQVVNGRVRSVDLGRQALPTVDPELPWLLPRARADVALIHAASQMTRRLRDYGWKASTGPLVWNRHKRQISAAECSGAVPILWAADIAAGTVRRNTARDAQRWLMPRERDGFMVLTEPAVLVQRTTAPEQPRRLIVACLTAQTLRDWGGAVVVENHVNVLRPIDGSDGRLSAELLTALLNTPTLDRLYRCLTGTVAVSAYELEALPLPPDETLAALAGVPSNEVAGVLAKAFA